MNCNLCPRNCGADRKVNTGFCGVGEDPVIARAAPHFWEEPCLSGTRGAGAVFFSGCSLRCVFCQNREISAGGQGRPVTVSRLREIFEELAEQGVHNIDLVTPTHYTDAILQALAEPLPVPVVWNSSAYESVDTLKRLEGRVQIYLPDMKYSDSAAADKYSAAKDYPETAKSAILEMFRQRGPAVFDSDGIMQSGVIIRHMMLPGNVENTLGVIDWVSDTFRDGEVVFSLMSQYTPPREKTPFPELDRRLCPEEYAAAFSWMELCGIKNGFCQELSSAREEYTPPFDLTGV